MSNNMSWLDFNKIIDAWKKIHDDFGKLDFEELFIPAINIARDGFKVTKVVANAWNKSLKKLTEDQNSKKLILNNGRNYKVGEVRTSEPLAKIFFVFDFL